MGKNLRITNKVRYLTESGGGRGDGVGGGECWGTTVEYQVFSFPKECLVAIIPRPEVVSSLACGPVDWSPTEEDQMECVHLH